MLLLIISAILTGCADDNDETEQDREQIEELLVDVVFDERQHLIFFYPIYTITSEKQTLIWRDKNHDVKLIESSDGTDKITYEKDNDGKIYNRKIHVGPDGLKKYSGAYVDTFGESMVLKKNNDE